MITFWVRPAMFENKERYYRMKNRKHTFVVALVVVALFAVLAVGCSNGQPADSASASAVQEASPQVQLTSMGRLLSDLVAAHETPSAEANQAIDADLAQIQSENAQNYAIASSIANHWKAVYLDPNYQLFLHSGGEYATELQGTAIVDSPTHAFVVLGYELKNGEMADELKARCEAAAAAARSYPNTVLVCSGGATGQNNPENHTEAGMMRDYLVNVCGIDESRILVDERARTTAENAINTLQIMQQNGCQTMTIVTSGYHQRWGQADYNAMTAIMSQQTGYAPQIVANYCANVVNSDPRYEHDDRIAVMQIAQMLQLPESDIEALRQGI